MWKKLYIVGYVTFAVCVMLAMLEMTKKDITILKKDNGTEWIVEVEGEVTYRKATLLDYKDARIKYIKE